MTKDYRLYNALLELYINAKFLRERKNSGATAWELEILKEMEETTLNKITSLLEEEENQENPPRNIS